MIHLKSIVFIGLLAFCMPGTVGKDISAQETTEKASTGSDLNIDLQLEEIVRSFRQIIVLMSDRSSLSETDQKNAYIIGKLLFEEGIPKREKLADQLWEALSSGKSIQALETPPMAAFLLRLEKDPQWHDADKLAFKEVLDTLIEKMNTAAPVSEADKILKRRLEEDRAALSQIQALYDKELDAIFGQFATRGMTISRERWESYLAYLRTLFSAKAIIAEHGHRIAPAKKEPARSERKTPTVPRLPDKTLVLTFDDGPHRQHTPKIKEVLEQFQAKGIFFEVGENIGRLGKDGDIKETKAAQEARTLQKSGHILANHTFTHPFLPKLDDRRQETELDLAEKMIVHVQDRQSRLFRPPYGAYDGSLQTALAARNLNLLLWDIDSQDWADPIPKSIANRVIAEARQKGRGVILLHDIHSRSVEALPLILETLESDGFNFALWNGVELLPGTTSKSKGPKPEAEPLYKESFAVIIGINAYHKWPRLNYATADALAVKDLLEASFHFNPENITLLLNEDATRERIMAALGDALGNQNKVGSEDRVLIFFAGHGTTRKLPSGKSLGYIVPVEADMEHIHSQCISMTNFQDFNDSIPAKHILYLMDACYGGLGVTRGGPAGENMESRKYIREVTRRTARQMLTAGGPDEQVADNGPNGHSVFTWTLLEGFKGKADLNSDNVVTASELFTYIGPAVSSVSRQTPAFGNLVGSGGGDVVFELSPNTEYLSAMTTQLDEEAIRLNSRLESIRREISQKKARNEKLRKELAQAQAELQKTAEKKVAPTDAQLVRKKSDEGLALYKERKYDEALKVLQEAFTLQPSNAQIANNLGYVYFRMGRNQEALEWYQRTLALDPQRAVAWVNIASAWEAAGDAAQALNAYNRFLELAPNHASAPFARERVQELTK